MYDCLKFFCTANVLLQNSNAKENFMEIPSIIFVHIFFVAIFIQRLGICTFFFLRKSFFSLFDWRDILLMGYFCLWNFFCGYIRFFCIFCQTVLTMALQRMRMIELVFVNIYIWMCRNWSPDTKYSIFNHFISSHWMWKQFTNFRYRDCRTTTEKRAPEPNNKLSTKNIP